MRVLTVSTSQYNIQYKFSTLYEEVRAIRTEYFELYPPPSEPLTETLGSVPSRQISLGIHSHSALYSVLRRYTTIHCKSHPLDSHSSAKPRGSRILWQGCQALPRKHGLKDLQIGTYSFRHSRGEATIDHHIGHTLDLQ